VAVRRMHPARPYSFRTVALLAVIMAVVVLVTVGVVVPGAVRVRMAVPLCVIMAVIVLVAMAVVMMVMRMAAAAVLMGVRPIFEIGAHIARRGARVLAEHQRLDGDRH